MATAAGPWDGDAADETEPPDGPLPGVPEIDEEDEEPEERLALEDRGVDPDGPVCWGETLVDESDLRNRYAEETLEYARHHVASYDLEEGLWEGLHQPRTHITVPDSMTAADIARYLESGMRDHLAESRWEIAKSVGRESWMDLSAVLAGLASKSAGWYATNEPDALSPLPELMIGGGGGRLLDRYGSRDTLENIRRVVGTGEALREVHENLIDHTMDHLYIVDTKRRDRDLGEIDDVAHEHGAAALEEENLMAEAGYEPMKKKPEDEIVGSCSYFALVLDGTKEKRGLRTVLEEYTDVDGVRTAHDAVTAEPVYRAAEHV